jgi:hypothetical protein
LPVILLVGPFPVLLAKALQVFQEFFFEGILGIMCVNHYRPCGWCRHLNVNQAAFVLPLLQNVANLFKRFFTRSCRDLELGQTNQLCRVPTRRLRPDHNDVGEGDRSW